MARDDRKGQDNQPNAAPQPGSRDRYRDNDDVRMPLGADQRADDSPDTRNEARGDARENVGNHARGTAAAPRVGGNDKNANRGDDEEPAAHDLGS